MLTAGFPLWLLDRRFWNPRKDWKRAAFVIEVRFHPRIELEARLVIGEKAAQDSVFYSVGADCPRPRSDARAIACAKLICRDARPDPRNGVVSE